MSKEVGAGGRFDIFPDSESSITIVASWLQMKELLVSKGVFASGETN